MQVPGRLRLTHVKGLSFTGIRNLMGQHKTLATFLSICIYLQHFSVHLLFVSHLRYSPSPQIASGLKSDTRPRRK